MAGLRIHFAHTIWPPDLVNSIEQTQIARKRNECELQKHLI